MNLKLKILFFLLFAFRVNAESDLCDHMMSYDSAMQMCMPIAMAGMPMSMLMFKENAFLTAISETGPRGRSNLSSPNFVMFDIGASITGRHYINLDFMGTLERWTTPEQGYPELLQIGEENNQGIAYLDAQHPHSSPVMGLTLSDTISFGSSKNYLKLFFAPRGEATDGPIAFMHRATGAVNPDAPLGHHIGQDVGHISGTVVGGSLKIDENQFEFSSYHGAEPKPQNVDLPISNLDSYSFRFIRQFSSQTSFMFSYAYISNPEPSQPDIISENRYSASLYNQFKGTGIGELQNTFILGSISNYDHASSLTSFTEELLIESDPQSIWMRFEALQRTSAELEINSVTDLNAGKWVEALTLGYTRNLKNFSEFKLSWGGSLSLDFLPQEFQNAYGPNPLTSKVFLQLSGMKMWHL